MQNPRRGRPSAKNSRRLGLKAHSTSVGRGVLLPLFAEQESGSTSRRSSSPSTRGRATRKPVLKHNQGPGRGTGIGRRSVRPSRRRQGGSTSKIRAAAAHASGRAGSSRPARQCRRAVGQLRAPSFRAAGPIPNDIKKDHRAAPNMSTYYGGLDEASRGPTSWKAKAAFEDLPQVTSVTYQFFFDEYSRKCELWLSKTYKNEYHAPIDEFRASGRTTSAARPRRPALPAADRPASPTARRLPQAPHSRLRTSSVRPSVLFGRRRRQEGRQGPSTGGGGAAGHNAPKEGVAAYPGAGEESDERG